MKKYGLFSHLDGEEELLSVYDTLDEALSEKEWCDDEDQIHFHGDEFDISINASVREIEYTDEIKNFIKEKEASHGKFIKAIQKLKENKDSSDLDDEIDFNELIEDLFNE